MRSIALSFAATFIALAFSESAEATNFRRPLVKQPVQRVVVKQQVQRVRIVQPIVRRQVVVHSIAPRRIVLQQADAYCTAPLIVARPALLASGGCAEFFSEY